MRPPAGCKTGRGPVFGLALLLAAALAGCSNIGQLSPQLSSDQPTQPDVSPAAQREHARILAAYGGAYDNPRLAALVERTVDKLVAASERPDIKYRVTILDSPAVNAFALPTGQLYITRGLLALSNDTSELASVLSHEMAHVIARHAAIREDQARKVALVDNVINKVLSDPEIGMLALAKSKIALASFSRSQEFEADGIGVGISARAGFDPYGAERFLTSMGRNATLKSAGAASGDSQSLDFLSSHPATPDRVKNAVTSARQHSAPGAGDREKADYLASIDGVIFGEDPSEGLVRGRRYLHPKLGFTFMAPDGFVLDNTAQAVLGIKEGGGQALRLDVVRVPVEQTLGEYLGSGWIENVDKTIETITINGFPAATATAKGDEWNFRLYAVRFGSEVYRFVYAAKQKSADSDRAFRDSIGSFRRMTLAEIKDARPLRLKVVTVTPSDTPERLASRMALADRPLQRFLVLNGLSSGQALKPGDQVKIVVE